eukprot:TRINITY_DN14163_c0_g2_i9.p1 TRINITY_DN14163_c0_g2~~TRINITY_DN14163_c0_g2_i9.p1  ORF type:complete len:397 (-),score=94.15 TRINITY_DN14163_c0_g2_i9:132-1322(-)
MHMDKMEPTLPGIVVDPEPDPAAPEAAGHTTGLQRAPSTQFAGWQPRGHGAWVDAQEESETNYVLYKSKLMDALNQLRKIKSGYRTLFFYMVLLIGYMLIMGQQLGLVEVSTFLSSLRAMATGRRRGFVVISGEFFDPPFYNRNVYSVRTFWKWWERFLSSQVFAEYPHLIDAKGYSTQKNVTRLNNFNDLAFAAVMTLQIGDESECRDRAYYRVLDTYSSEVMSNPPDVLPGVQDASSLSGLTNSEASEIRYSSTLNGYPLYFWEAPKTKEYTKAIEELQENYENFLHTSNASFLSYISNLTAPGDTIAAAQESGVINNRTRVIKLRIPSYNAQLDVVGIFGWDVLIDMAGYWQFRYIQQASRRDPYDTSTVRYANLRMVAEICLLYTSPSPRDS